MRGIGAGHRIAAQGYGMEWRGLEGYRRSRIPHWEPRMSLIPMIERFELDERCVVSNSFETRSRKNEKESGKFDLARSAMEARVPPSKRNQQIQRPKSQDLHLNSRCCGVTCRTSNVDSFITSPIKFFPSKFSTRAVIVIAAASVQHVIKIH